MILTGTESSAERSEPLVPEKTESELGSDSDSVVQMLGKESVFEFELVPKPASTLSLGKSIRSSMWSKKLPQSISSMKLGPIIF